MNNERKLASVRRIKAIEPIEGADAIEIAVVDGWRVVTKKGEYKPGGLAVYLEIDSWVPHELAPFLSKGSEPRVYNGVAGERLRTIKLRGQISQGLLLPLSVVKDRSSCGDIWQVGTDLTDALGIQLWEAPVPVEMVGLVRGSFPTYLVGKTGLERVQNVWDEVKAMDTMWHVTTKLDGTSCTIMWIDGELRVASKNLELKVEEANYGNLYVSTAMRVDEKLRSRGRSMINYALQGEIVGPGIQGNRGRLQNITFVAYNAKNLESGVTALPATMHEYWGSIVGLDTVPVVSKAMHLPDTMEELLAMADEAKLPNGLPAEGLVFRSVFNAEDAFKVISNRYLMGG